MAKRTKEDIEKEEIEDSDIDVSSTDEEELQIHDDESDDLMVNVDFEFFNLNPTVDFQATKNFLRQLFQDDSVFFSLSELADFILKEGHIGTTIKTDGTESDPFSILSVINLTDNLKKKSIQDLVKYYIDKTSRDNQFNILLRQVLSPASKFRIGLIFSERLINMPVETMPPMYKMLLEEMENSEQREKEYNFDYFLIPSRVYEMVASVVDKELEEDDGLLKNHKKVKKQSGEAYSEYDYIHYEDELFEKNSLHHGYFEYTNKKIDADGRRVFNDYGIDPKLSLVLIDRKSLAKAVVGMSEAFPY